MNVSKRRVLSLVAFIVLASLAACGGNPTPEPTVARPTRAPIAATQPPQVVPTHAPPSNTQEDDLARVKANQTLIVGTSADYAPFAFYASDNSLDGFDIAVIREVGKRMGVQVQVQDYAFDGLFDALKLGQMDAAIAALSIIPAREQIVDFSVPYYLGEDAALARSDANFEIHSASDTMIHKTGVQRGSVYESWLAAAYLSAGIVSPDSNYVPYESATDMVQGLRNKQVDVVILGAQPALADAKSGDLKLVGQSMNAQEYGIATRKGSTLIPEFNRVLLQMYQDGSLNAVMKQYLQLDSQEALPLPEVASQPTEVANSGQPVPVTATPRAGSQPQGNGCVLGMNFVADVNLDDQNMKAPPVMQPGQPFTKTWRVQNNGTCEWQPDYALTFVRGNVAGADMGGSRVVVGRVVKPGETLDLSANLIAPNVPGTYQGFWQMRSNTNAGFGKTVWVGIVVPGAQVVPTAPIANMRLRADSMQVYPGQCTVIRWDVDNVTAVGFIDGGNVQGVNAHDARTVCPQGTTTYTLRATTGNQTIESPITITVVNSGPNFRADNSQIQQGQCTTVRWNVTNAQAVYFFDGAREQGVGGNDARNVCPQATTTYRLRVVNADNSQNQYNLNVNVIPAPVQPTVAPPQGNKPRIQSFTVDKNKIKRGACVNLQWATKNTPVGVTIQREGVTINEMGGSNGSMQDCPQGTGLFTYTLIAGGEGIGDQVVQQSLTVQVGK